MTLGNRAKIPDKLRRILSNLDNTASSSGGTVDWSDITSKPSTFTPSSHSHSTSDVTGLNTALNGKQPLATVLTNTTAAFTTSQETKLAGIATGAQVNVPTDLSYTAGTRVLASSTGTDITLPLVTTGDAGLAPASGGGTTNFLRADGTWSAPAGGSATDLSYNPATRLLESSTGADVTLPLFTSTRDGLTPLSGGGTTNFLRADGTWAAPSGGGGSTIYYGHLQSNYTLTSTTAVQKLFNWSTNGALTLPTGVYRFRSMIYLTTMSATSGNGSFHLKGDGTATVARVLYNVLGFDNTSPLAAAAKTGTVSVTEDSAANMVSGGTGTGLTAIIEGFFDVTVTGTIIPSITLRTAAAAVVQAGSFFECERVGDTATAASSGWT